MKSKGISLLVLVAILLSSTIVSAAVSKVPQDSRLGSIDSLRTLDSYFPFKQVDSAEQWARRAEYLKKQLRVSNGLWPLPTKTALNPIIHGKMDMGDYTVEKVYFESIPGHFVTGNLYRPVGRQGKRPAVLCPHGHWGGGRFLNNTLDHIRQQIATGAERFVSSARSPLQARCVQLARMGCVVFHYDMQGYADSVQLPHKPLRREHLCGKENWGLSSPMAALNFQNNMGIQSWISIRSIDFLLSLPDVDPDRIAVTGASGGGTQSMIIGALDERIAASIPAVMVSTGMQGGCECENAPYLRIGAGNIDIVALTAPRPLYLIGADDWTREIETKALPDLKKLYSMLGAADKVGGKANLQFGHNYNNVSRGLMYNWINKHFGLGYKEPIIEKDFVVLTKEQMSVWDTAHPKPEGEKIGDKHEREVMKWFEADSKNQIDTLLPKDKKSLAQYRRVVAGAFEIIIGRKLSDVGQVKADTIEEENTGKFTKKVLLINHVDKKEQLPAVVLKPKGKIERTVIWITENGKAGLFADNGSVNSEVQSLLKKGSRVIGVDLLFQGDFLTDDKPFLKTRVLAGGGWISCVSRTFGYNRPLFSRRVHDILTVIKYVKSIDNGKISLAGFDETSASLVIAAGAMAEGSVEKIAVDTKGFRFASVDRFDHPAFLPGSVKYQDLPGLMALNAPGRLWVAGEDSNLSEVVSSAYKTAASADNLNIYTGSDDKKISSAIKWLLK